MKTGWLSTLAVSALLLFAPRSARAQDAPECPPGEWFCEEPGDEPVVPDEEGAPEGDLPPDAEGDRWFPDSEDEDPDIDVRRPAPPVPTDSGWSEGSGGRVSPWALAMRLQGVMLDGRRGSDARLGGIGASGRYTLNPVVTLDLGLDSIVGRDYNGFDRSELSLSFSSLFFLNQHPVIRTYVLVGLNTSMARVEVYRDDQTWGYFGGQAGLGLDIALDSRVSLNVDVVGFMRGRTDSRAAREPEFTDSRGRVTNTSGGGLLRGGVVFRF